MHRSVTPRFEKAARKRAAMKPGKRNDGVLNPRAVNRRAVLLQMRSATAQSCAGEFAGRF
jgi:hypothetical protein